MLAKCNLYQYLKETTTVRKGGNVGTFFMVAIEPLQRKRKEVDKF